MPQETMVSTPRVITMTTSPRVIMALVDKPLICNQPSTQILQQDTFKKSYWKPVQLNGNKQSTLVHSGKHECMDKNASKIGPIMRSKHAQAMDNILSQWRVQTTP